VARLFFLVSGEHPTLPFSEIESILDAEGYKYGAAERLKQVFRLEADKNATKPVIARAAMTRACCQELFSCTSTFAEIARSLRRASLDTVIRKSESFAVRIRRIGGVSVEGTSMDLEKRLGALVLEKIVGAKVKLRNPKRIFLGVLTEDRFVFGLKLGEVITKPFIERRPRKRPFFQPSAIAAKLARCMVNLTRVKKGDLVLDPFCGTASFLIEAGLMGCHVIGADAQRHMVKGGLRNLRYFNVTPEAMVVADAKHLPIVSADCIVTDPPYGRTASTLGKNTRQIVKSVLPEFKNLLHAKNRVCIAAPKSIGIRRIAEKVGLRHLESHYVYVHRSLTREIAVLEKA
jgi:tRNA (guanine10-N2)-dimethyltransferase